MTELEQASSAITYPEQVCYERIIPQESHYYQTRKTPGDTGDPLCPLPLDAVSFTSKVWRKLDLKVFFMRPHPQQSEILQWASEWSKHCAILFYHTTKPKDSDIRVDFNEGQGSWSYLGTDATRVPKESFTMNLGFVDRPTVLHEFGHSLGLIHEHQSPFPGGFEWDRENVIRDLSGPPNYWDVDRIENNMFRRYKRSDLDGSLYDSHSIMHYGFPRAWIKGHGYPDGIDRNTELSARDKEHVKRLYGPPRMSAGERSVPPPIPQQPENKTKQEGRTTTVVPVYPTVPVQRTKPVTSLPPPRTDKIYDIHVYEPNKGELSGPGAELLVRFHTSSEERARYTIQTLGDTDMIVALLGPDDYTNVITVNDDGAGDGRNALIVERLMPNRDYYVQFQTFHPQGGKFEFAITSCEGQEVMMCCDFNHDGSLLAVGTSSGTVTVYQFSTGKAIFYLPSMQQTSLPVTSVHFHLMAKEDKDNSILLVSYASGQVRHWHVSTKQCLSTIHEDRHTLAARFAPDYLTFATAGSDCKVNIYDHFTKTLTAVLEPSVSSNIMDGHRSRIFGLAFHPHDSHTLISAGWDDTVQFWDTRQPHSVRKISGPHVCGDALDIEASSLNIVTGSWRYQESLQIWDFGSGKPISTAQSNLKSKLYAACWTSNNVVLAGGSQKHLCVLVDTKSDEIVGEISGLDHGVYGVAHHEGKVAVVAGTTLYILNISPKMYTSTKELQ